MRIVSQVLKMNWVGQEEGGGHGARSRQRQYPVATVETMVLSGNCETFKMAGIVEVGSSKRC